MYRRGRKFHCETITWLKECNDTCTAMNNSHVDRTHMYIFVLHPTFDQSNMCQAVHIRTSRRLRFIGRSIRLQRWINACRKSNAIFIVTRVSCGEHFVKAGETLMLGIVNLLVNVVRVGQLVGSEFFSSTLCFHNCVENRIHHIILNTNLYSLF